MPGRSLLPLGPDPCLVVILVLCLPGASFGCVFASYWLAYLFLVAQEPVLPSLPGLPVAGWLAAGLLALSLNSTQACIWVSFFVFLLSAIPIGPKVQSQPLLPFSVIDLIVLIIQI